MSIVRQPLLFADSLGEKYLYTLYDSGANLSLYPDYLKDLETLTQLKRIRQIGIASAGHFIEVTQAVRLDFSWMMYCFRMNS
jgi:hypothetical protein